jgi:hypothetical protein
MVPIFMNLILQLLAKNQRVDFSDYQRVSENLFYFLAIVINSKILRIFTVPGTPLEGGGVPIKSGHWFSRVVWTSYLICS